MVIVIMKLGRESKYYIFATTTSIEQCHNLFQNFNSRNCHQIESNIEITAQLQNIKRRYRLVLFWALQIPWLPVLSSSTDTNSGVLSPPKLVPFALFDFFSWSYIVQPCFVICSNLSIIQIFNFPRLSRIDNEIPWLSRLGKWNS